MAVARFCVREPFPVGVRLTAERPGESAIPELGSGGLQV